MRFPYYTSILHFSLLSLVPWLLSTVVHALPELERRDAFSDTGLKSALWIWLPGPNLPTDAAVGSLAFIKTFTSPAGKTAVTAEVALTVDNHYILWVNGQPVGTSGTAGWESVKVLSAALNASANVFSVLAVNDKDADMNPGGLLASIHILYSDGSKDTIVSDTTWLASAAVPPDFPLPSDISRFGAAQEAAPYGEGPWGNTTALLPPSTLALDGSEWLWSTADAAISAGVSSVGFRKTIASPSGKTASSATILASVDNTFALFVNDKYVGAPPVDSNLPGSPSSWEHAQRFAVPSLTAASNVFTVIATNYGSQSDAGSPSSAGFIGAIEVTYTDNTKDVFRTDASWLASDGGFTTYDSFLRMKDTDLKPAVSQGKYGMGPWNKLAVADALNLNLNGASSSTGPSLSGGGPPSGTTIMRSSSLKPAKTSALPNFTPDPTPSSPGAGVSVRVDRRLVIIFGVSILLSFVVVF
ncbi:hypothetical protein C8J57DRAFT_1127958 [Mycena rebaudengoi]|nr:hypothetical protein C8J57DRAFT_1127958 [Mycena rebaudengoi]